MYDPIQQHAPDSLILRGMHFYGYHGLQPEERVIGHRYDVDVEMHGDFRAAGTSDDIQASFSYSEAARRIRTIMEGPAFTIFESVAEAIATDLLETYTMLTSVTVTVSRPNAAVAGAIVESASIRINRFRNS